MDSETYRWPFNRAVTGLLIVRDWPFNCAPVAFLSCYLRITGDVVLSCRGTVIKSAVFKTQDKTIIASANLIVIRPKEKIRGEFIKIFFESPVGLAIIKSFQRGTTIMNINYSDIMEMEIPLLTINKQQEMINQYNEELKVYKETIKKAEARWSDIKGNIYNELI